MTITQSHKTVLQVLSPVLVNVSYKVPTDSSVDSSILALETTIAPSPPIAAQSPPETVASPLPLHHSTCYRKSTKLLDFAYSCYSSSFTSFLASFYHFS